MIKTSVVVKADPGFDGRPIALLVQEASQYASKVYIQVAEKNINAKSIMGMMSLNLIGGEEITVVTDGEDEQKAAEGIKFSYMNIIYAALIRILAERPQLNRFAMNGTLYARNQILVSLAIKKKSF